MALFMVQIELADFTDELVATIPLQREYIMRLFESGQMQTYSVSAQRTQLWCVLQTADEQEALQTIASFPLHRFFSDILCYPLLFHNMLPASMPSISLN